MPVLCGCDDAERHSRMLLGVRESGGAAVYDGRRGGVRRGGAAGRRCARGHLSVTRSTLASRQAEEQGRGISYYYDIMSS